MYPVRKFEAKQIITPNQYVIRMEHIEYDLDLKVNESSLAEIMQYS